MIGEANPALQMKMHLMALCSDCKRYHEIEMSGAHLVQAVDDWHQKHLGHDIEFISRYRNVPGKLNDKIFQEQNSIPWYLQDGWSENADIKLAYASSAAYTITLASLASDTNLLIGRESTAVSNTTNLYLDYGIAGIVTVGTTPTANTVIHVMAYGSQNDTPTYPDVFDGTDSAETITNAGVKTTALAFLSILNVSAATSNVGYAFAPVSLSMLMGGFLPKNHGIFVTHNTGVALNATGGNHVINYTGVYRTV